MEQTKKLSALVKELETTLAGAETARTIAEVDAAKVAALKMWRELQRQLNRAYLEITTVPRAARAKLVEAGRKDAQRLTAPTPEPTPESSPAPTPLEEAVEAKVTQKSKKTKKTKK